MIRMKRAILVSVPNTLGAFWCFTGVIFYMTQKPKLHLLSFGEIPKKWKKKKKTAKLIPLKWVSFNDPCFQWRHLSGA